MTYAIIFLVLVGLAVAYSGRLARKMLHRLAGQVEQLRALTMARLEYRPSTSADATHRPPDGALDGLTRDLPAVGCVVLGDQIEAHADGSVIGLTRWFADANGTVVGWAGFAGTSGTSVMVLFSEAQDGVFVTTIRGPNAPGLQQPPFVRRQRVAFEDGLPAALDAHRAAVRHEAGGESGAVRTHGLEEATSLAYRLRAATMAWRKAQPADTLLEQDVRTVLGETHANFAESLLKLLRSRAA